MKILLDSDIDAFEAMQDEQKIITLDEAREDILDLVANGDVMEGMKLPWAKTHDKFALRFGEVTIFAGMNGHGKSEILGQICAQTLPIAKWLIASLEMPVKRTAHRMIKHLGGVGDPTVEYASQLIDKTTENLLVYDQLDTVPSGRMIKIIQYCAQERGVKFFMIDSLVKCGMGVDDYNAQKHFIDKLCGVAKANDICICLVHHMAKQKDEYTVPNKMSVKGAGEITDLADNLVIVFRNKGKERDIREGKEVDKLEPDTRFIVDKQRLNGFEETFALYYHKDTGQFLSSPDARPFVVNF